MKIDYNQDILERFIPIAFHELKESVYTFETASIEQIDSFASLIESYYHQIFHSRLIDIKRSYNPFNPDSDTLTNKVHTKEQLETLQADFLANITPLLNDANYEEITEQDLNEAMSETSPYGVEVNVDFEDFEIIKLFFRGSALKQEQLRDPKTLYLKKKEHTTHIYRRLFILFKQKNAEEKEQGQIYLKLFKDIPRNDLEMLFPNTKVKISLIDKLKLAVTGGGGTIGGAATLLSKLATALDPIALLTAIGAFAAILWRQISSIFNHRVKYMAQLAKSLYYYNLDNNAGVISHMVDIAEAEEAKEAFLAYIFLLNNPNGLTKVALDTQIENFIEEKFFVKTDFEIDDAIDKLNDLGVISKEQEIYKALDIESSIKRLQEQMTF